MDAYNSGGGQELYNLRQGYGYCPGIGGRSNSGQMLTESTTNLDTALNLVRKYVVIATIVLKGGGVMLVPELL